MRAMIAPVVLLTALATTHAHAQTTPQPKSPSKATWLSVLSTVVPTAGGIGLIAVSDGTEPLQILGGVLIGLGVEIGPSVGHFYAGRTGLLLPRILASGAFAYAALDSDNWDTGEGLAIVGIAVAGATVLIDIALASDAATAWNKKHGAITAWLAPVPRDGHLALGAGVRLRF